MATLHDLQQLFSGRPPHEIAIEVNGFTGFKKTRLEELTPEEINRLYHSHVPQETDIDAEYNFLREQVVKKEWRSKILAAAERTGIKEPQCFQKFNHWMLYRSTFKKHMNAHNIEELKALHRQIMALESNNARSAQKPQTKAWWAKASKLKTWN